MAVFSAACADGDDPVDASPPPDDPGSGDAVAVVRRSSLVVRVMAEDGEAARMAEALGASGAGVPDADIRVRREGDTDVRIGVTDATGSHEFADILPGRYHVSAFRPLNEAELARAAQADTGLFGVNALGGAGSMTVGDSTSVARLTVVAGRRGSLIISEIHDWRPRVGVGPEAQYSQALYVEVCNNADTTVHLDGKIIAGAMWFTWESSLDGCFAEPLR